MHENNTVKTMKFELIRDSIELLENDRSYALSKGYENVFYSTLIDLVLQLRKYDRSIFLSNVFKYSKYPKFVYMLIFNIIEKIKLYKMNKYTNKTYILILNYNNAEDTVECIKSILKIDNENICIVLIDNASTNDSVSILDDWFISKNIKIGKVSYME